MCFKLSYIEATRTHIRDLLKVEETNYDIHSINEVSSQYFTNEPDMLKAVYKGFSGLLVFRPQICKFYFQLKEGKL